MTVDTKFSVGFSEAFCKYEISEIDSYFSEDTVLICNGKSAEYKDIRNNVFNACKEKKYTCGSDSYGHGNNNFVEGVQNIVIFFYGELDGEFFASEINMKLRQTGPFTFKVEALECDDPIFEYLFFGIA